MKSYYYSVLMQHLVEGTIGILGDTIHCTCPLHIPERFPSLVAAPLMLIVLPHHHDN